MKTIKRCIPVVVFPLLVHFAAECHAGPQEYTLIIKDGETVLYDLGLMINKDFPGLAKNENGGIVELIQNINSIFYYYATLTHDGSEHYSDDNWFTPEQGDDSDTDYFYIRFTPMYSTNQLFVNLDQDQIAPGKAGYTLSFNGVTDFNDTWYEQVTRVIITDYKNGKYSQIFTESFTIAPVPAVVKGDCDASGSVDLADVILSLQVASGMSPAGSVSVLADVDGDKRIGLVEAIYAARMVK